MWILCLFTLNIEPYLLWKTMNQYLWMSSAAVVIGVLRVKNLVSLMPLTSRETTTLMSTKNLQAVLYHTENFVNMHGPHCLVRSVTRPVSVLSGKFTINAIQWLEGKKCKWAALSGSTAFANSNIFTLDPWIILIPWLHDQSMLADRPILLSDL